MEFEHSEKVRELQERVEAFMAEHVYPNEEDLFAQVSEATDGSRYRSSKS
jgi:acyl-CoA dehydrogenase